MPDTTSKAMSKATRYQEIDHTADLAIRAYGADAAELFANAAFALFDLMLDLEQVEGREEVVIEVGGAGWDDLMNRWLSHLLQRFYIDEVVFKDFTVTTITENRIVARTRGEGFDVRRHGFKGEIKAVTYHGLRVQGSDEGWEASIVFDV